MTQTKTLITAISTIGLLIAPLSAVAYLSPYEVLLSPEYAWPTRPRESEDKVALQQAASAERREREQAAARAERNPEDPEHAAASSSSSSQATSSAAAEANPEFDSLMRTLERIKENQEETRLRQQILGSLAEQGLVLVPEDSLHGGAPLDLGKGDDGKGKGPIGKGPLVPSGAGTTLALMTGLAAIGWTLRRSGRLEALAR